MKNMLLLCSLFLAFSSLKANATTACTVEAVRPMVETLTPMLGLEDGPFERPTLSYVGTFPVNATGEDLLTYKVKIKPVKDANDYNTYFLFVDVTEGKSGKCLLRSINGKYGAE